MARIKISINGNEFEAEGDEVFLRGLYEDFKLALATTPAHTKSGGQARQIDTGSDGAPADEEAPEANKRQPPTRKKKAKPVTADRKLNLHPDSNRSFADFVTEKAPNNNNEKNVVSVYYLTEVLGQASASASQVISCYDDRGWRVPADIKNSLQITASNEGWINTQSSDEIVLEVKGQNQVKHDMPAKEAKR